MCTMRWGWTWAGLGLPQSGAPSLHSQFPQCLPSWGCAACRAAELFQPTPAEAREPAGTAKANTTRLCLTNCATGECTKRFCKLFSRG